MRIESSAIDQKASSFLGLGWAALGVLAFSLTFPATALALRGFDPYVVGAGRSVVGAVAGAGCLIVARAPVPPRARWTGLVAVALGCGIGFGLLSAVALGHTTSTHAAVVIGLLPAATAAVAVLRLGERPPWPFWAASALGTSAVVAYVLSSGAGRLEPADLLLLGALVAAAVGYAEGGALAREMPGWQVIAWGLLIALPLSLTVTLVALDHPSGRLTATSLEGFAYVSLVSVFLGFFAWYRGLARAGVARASQLQLAQPLLTIVWSVLLLGEHAGPGALITAVVVVLCVLVTQRSRAAPDVPPADADEPSLGATARTRVRRHADRARAERAELHEVLDAGMVAHVGLIIDGQPRVLPMGYARDGDRLLLHGSSRNRMLRGLATGAELCVTITLLDGIVLAATAFTHSMNYRSAVVYGHAQPITDSAAKAAALDHFVDFMAPGRSQGLARHTRQELAATLVVAVSLAEASVKARTGGPRHVSSREATPPWVGVIPVALTRGVPEEAGR